MLFDNQSAIAIAHNPIFHSITKHMEIDVLYVRDQVMSKQLVVYHISSLDQWVDDLTKPLSTTHFQLLRSKLSVQDFVLKNPSP